MAVETYLRCYRKFDCILYWLERLYNVVVLRLLRVLEVQVLEEVYHCCC